jgi:hypothetical protein
MMATIPDELKLYPGPGGENSDEAAATDQAEAGDAAATE